MNVRRYVLVFGSLLAIWCLGFPGLASAATIYGTVTDSNGPVAGINVTISRCIFAGGYLGLGCGVWSDSRVTAIDGTYIFTDLLSAEPLTSPVTIVVPGNWEETPYVYQRNTVDILEDDQSDQVDFQLELASTISGTIRKADGGVLTSNEIEHLKIEVHPAEGGNFFPYQASIESDGRYSILGLPSGRSFNVSAQGDGTVNYIQEWSIGAISVPDPLELAGAIDITSPGSQINGVDFQLDPGSTVMGKVYRQPEVSSGKVVVTETTAEGACSIASDSILNKYTVDVQEDGAYTVTGLGGGTYYVESYNYGDADEWLTGIKTDSSPDCEQAERLLVTPDNPTQIFDQRNFQIGTGGNISGSVVQAGKQVVTNDAYFVRFQESCTTVGDEPEVAVVSGQYTSPVLPAGDYLLALLNESGKLVGWRTSSDVAVDCSDAVLVHVDEDHTTAGVDFVLNNSSVLMPIYQLLLLK